MMWNTSIDSNLIVELAVRCGMDPLARREI